MNIKMKHQFKLTNRLALCAKMCVENKKTADIGTDHAYLPIWLVFNGKINFALACDIRTGPLVNAEKNIKKYKLDNIIKTRLSDGLQNINENEVEQIVIAGMGGNIVSKILKECSWRAKENKFFILQPMKYEERLREYLACSGYKILEERATICCGRVYTAMRVVYSGKPQKIENFEKYIGKLSESHDYPEAKAYIRKQIKNLQNHLKGAISENNTNQADYYSDIIKELENLLK